MFWDEIKEILHLIKEIRFHQIHEKFKPEEKTKQEEDLFWKLEQIEEKVDDCFNKLDLTETKSLIRKLEERAEENASMFKKLELMVNEFKGVVAMMEFQDN